MTMTPKQITALHEILDDYIPVDPPTRVMFRVQNEQGVGPYQLGAVILGLMKKWDHTEYSLRPCPVDERYFGREVEIEDVFGFATFAQLHAWFVPDMMELVNEHGFWAYRLRVKNLAATDIQAIGEPIDVGVKI